MSNPIKKPNIALLETGVNPYLTGFIIPVKLLPESGKFKKEEDMLVTASKLVEISPQTKLYIGTFNRTQMCNLKATTSQLLLWLMYEIKNGEDYVWINKIRCMKELNILSPKTYNSAILDMVVNGFITPSGIKDSYWINPRHFFNGSRINKFPSHVETVV